MRRGALLAALGAAAALWAPASAAAAFGPNDFDVFFEEQGGGAALQAGSHPFAMSTSFAINFTGVDEEAQPDGELKDATFSLPPGLVGNPTAHPRCETATFAAGLECPPAAQIGENTVELENPGTFGTDPVFNLVPPPGSAARLGFRVSNVVPVVVDVGVAPEPPFNLIATLRNTSQVLKVFGAELTVFGRGGEVPFLTAPTACEGPLASSYEALSWEGDTDAGFALTHNEAGAPKGFGGCEHLPFEPQVSALPTTASAASASGLRFELGFDQAGLLNSAPGARAQSALKELEVALPAGMTANPSLAEGLGVCTPADIERETLAAGPGEGCPEDSKIGTIEVRTPLLEQTLSGSVFLAAQDDPASSAPGAENPFDSLLAFYLVIKDPGLGILLKLPAKVEPDPETGQLTTTVSELPQIPFSHATFRFREGARAPLITPPGCGQHTTSVKLTPWARPGEELERKVGFELDSGPGGAPCPPGGPPFAPGFTAGTLSNQAGSDSPFLMRITRPDGHQDLSRLSAVLPAGVLARIAGLARCPEAAIARADAKSGRSELATPSCPPASRVGSILAGAGVGEALTYVSGSLYLAGPFGGAPLSAAAIVPAVAGPFDLGAVVVREALRLNPLSARVEVDGLASDAIPHVLAGIPLSLRDLRVAADRPAFTRNATSCDPAGTQATLWGAGTPAEPLPEAPLGLLAPYQAAGCQSLGFSPRLALRLKGGVRRGAHPALRAVVTPRPGDANFSRAVVKLPTSAFLDQAHIRTICTRVQFAAGAGHGSQCPKGARYGTARAWSPLLDEPLSGPVYLRSSDNNLPDLVLALKGPPSAAIEIELSARIDSVKGGIRSTFAAIPDAPVSRFILDMQGGKKGLIVNSTNLCKGRHRAKAKLTGQNGRLGNSKPLVRATKCPKAHHKRHSSRRKHNAGGQR